MDLSLAGLIGAVVGTAIAWVNYAVIVGFVTARLRALDKSQTIAERVDFERKIGLMRKIVLAVDVAVFAAIGYWFGSTLGG